MHRKGKRRSAAELVTRLVEIGQARLASALGVTPEAARLAMREVAHELCREFGGQPIYVPKDDEFLRDARNDQIWAEFDGTNHLALAAKHHLTHVQIYAIVAEMRAAHRRLSQPDLPGFEPADE